MASEGFHVPFEKLSGKTVHYHYAAVSLQEEIEATDWYRQRADACQDESLREVLLHNMREEIEHACMIIEWLRRNDPDWASNLKTYLFTDAPITEVEEVAQGREGAASENESGSAATSSDGKPPRSFTIGSLKGE